jgi:hypothetical protein
MEATVKYPKTYHLPFSQGLQNDDRRLEDEHCFDGKTVAVTIKMDGENTTMYRDTIHARSLYQMSHPSQHWVKAYHGQIKHLIPAGWRVCGENLYARHSIAYEELEHFFQVFSIWNKNNECLSYEDTVLWCKRNGLHHVKTETILEIEGADFNEVEDTYKEVVARGDEGVVIRNLESYKFEDFQKNIAKAVRKGHVQTDEHWTKTWVPNKMKS